MFELTHQLRVGSGWAMWQRDSLPSEGGIEDQPAKLMEALALIARIENTALRLEAARARTETAATSHG